MYDEVRTSVKSVSGEIENFMVNVGVHQELVLSPYLFSWVMDKLTKSLQDKAFWCMMFVDDMVLVHENKNVLEGILKRRREVLENN